MYKNNNQEINEINFSDRTPLTERVVRWYLATKGVEDTKLESQVDVQGCYFIKNDNHIHKADLRLTSKNNKELYIEVKGQMTYTEVNKLRFLLEHSEKDFYILQLTEPDWIVDNGSDSIISKVEMSKNAFEKQFKELLEFYEGKIEAQEMSQISKERLNQFIANRNKEYQSWVDQVNRKEQLANDNHETT